MSPVVELKTKTAFGPRVIPTAKHPSRMHRPHIIGGTQDQNDPSVIELFYAQGGSQGGLSWCSGELIGDHTVMTAGHCTDLSAGGEFAGQGGAALKLCTTLADFEAIANGAASGTNGCTVGALAMFNNKCTSNNSTSNPSTWQDEAPCEAGLVTAGNYIVVDQLINPNYAAHANNESPDDDSDIGLVHLSSSTLESGSAEPTLLTFNRTDEGTACTSVGTLKFVGYGITSSSQSATAGVKYTTTNAVKVLDAYHNYEGNPSAIGISSTCGTVSTNGGPTCSGDSGGPSMLNGVIYGVTSLGDQSCSTYSQDTRVDAHATWIDCVMTGQEGLSWGDSPNNGASTPSASTCSGYTSVSYPSGSSSGTSGSSGSSGSTGSTGSSDECQDCTQTGTCSGTGACYTFQPDGGGTDYCLDPCTSSSDCTGATECDTTQGVCAPTSGTCAGSGTTGSTGTGAFCSTCTSPSDCASGCCDDSTGMTCSATSGFCDDPNACASDADCGGNACDTSTGVCCGGTSGSNGSSGSTGSTGSSDECQDCTQTGTCSGSGACYTFQPDGGGTDYCLDPCTSNTDCTGAATCDTTQGVCAPTSQTCVGFVGTSGTTGSNGSTGSTGSTDECQDCTQNGTCSGSGACYTFTPDGGGTDYCLDACTTNADCPSNAPCDTTNMVCFPTSGTCVGYVAPGSSATSGGSSGTTGIGNGASTSTTGRNTGTGSTGTSATSIGSAVTNGSGTTSAGPTAGSTGTNANGGSTGTSANGGSTGTNANGNGGSTGTNANGGNTAGSGSGNGNGTAGTSGGPSGGFGGSFNGAASSSGSVAASTTSGNGAGGTTGSGVHLVTATASSSTGTTSGGSSGGCSSAGLGDLTPAIFALLGLLRRRRQHA